MTNITNSRVIIDIVMWLCWWPSEKPWAYQAGSLIAHISEITNFGAQSYPIYSEITKFGASLYTSP